VSAIPNLATSRLVLRPFVGKDVPSVVEFCGAREVADTMTGIPHPYRREDAESWISTHAAAFEHGVGATFAVEGPEGVVGAVLLMNIDRATLQAELGYWIGLPFWRKGYATEAAREGVRYAFEDVRLNRIYARCMVRNPASVRVLEKLGMTREGLLRQNLRRWEQFEDAYIYSILRSEWPR
jgi:RimJ/RimL family protein N-acetyltransferase